MGGEQPTSLTYLCQKIQPIGLLLQIQQCAAEEIEITTQTTHCGPQPRFSNWTISLTGWELVPFQPCYWKTGFINLNGQPFSYHGNSWKRIIQQRISQPLN